MLAGSSISCQGLIRGHLGVSLHLLLRDARGHFHSKLTLNEKQFHKNDKKYFSNIYF